MFIGSNGAGKSNVLEAIGVASASVDRGVVDRELQNKGVRITPPALMTSALPIVCDEEHSFVLSVRMSGEVDYKVELESIDDDRRLGIVTEECKKGGKPFFHRTKKSGGSSAEHAAISFTALAPDQGIWEPFRSIAPVHAGVTEAFEMLAQYAIYAPQIHFLRGQQGAPATGPSVGLHGESLPVAVDSILAAYKDMEGSVQGDFIIDALRLAFLPGWANSVHVGGMDDRLVSRAVANKGKGQKMLYFEDKYMEDSRKRLSVYDSSEGTLFLLFVAVLLVHPESPRIFALDNVDNGLNPAMTRKMIEKIIEVTTQSSTVPLDCGPRQVFLTSHNPTALDAFDLFNNDQRVFIVGRNGLGYTEIARLEPPAGMKREEWVATHHGNSLSKLWIEGAIEGALGPDL